MDLPYEKRFHFRDGSSVGSAEELQHKLEGISYQEFYHHVNTERNDFANWVRYVLKDEELAEHLQKVTSIVETIELLSDYVTPHTASPQDIQAKIERSFGVEIPVEDVPTTVAAPEHSGEMVNLEVIQEELTREEKSREEPAHEEKEYHTEHSSQRMLTNHDYTQLIVKEYMYGLVSGLVIGLVLGKLLTF